MKMFATTLACLLLSCGNQSLLDIKTIVIHGSPTDPRKFSDIHEEFMPYVKLFEDISGRKVSNIPINFDDIEEGSVVGLCTTYISDKKVYREITIKKKYWERSSEYEKEALILHELGHCVLIRDHLEDTFSCGDHKIPVSIMYPYTIGGSDYYKSNRDYYHGELSGRK